MQNKDTFSGYHPIVNFMYFAVVMVFTMFFMHPISLVISFISSVSYCTYLKGFGKTKSFLLRIAPLMFMAVIINPMFNHEGITILTYLPSGNPFTLESIVYGICASLMIGAMIIWFCCYTEVMTSDKFIYIFGRIIPVMSLIISMALRFVPRYIEQFNKVREAQKCMGRDITDGNAFQKIKNSLIIFSITVTWALENAVETADSMKSRGYGLPGRTAFSIYRFDERDKMAVIWIAFCVLFVGCGKAVGGMKWSFFPHISAAEFMPLTVSFQLVFMALCFTPVVIDKMEDRKWKHLKYEI